MSVIIFKPTEACNSNCIYCDVVAKRSSIVMPDVLMETVFKKIGEYLTSKPDEIIEFIWHGGEPFLLGANYFVKAKQYQEKYCGNNARQINHTIQSNVTMVTDEYLDALSALGITSIGTSYECIPNLRGYGERRDSYSYKSDFFKGIRILEKRGFSWGFIYVVTKLALKEPLNIFYNLNNLKPDGCFSMNAVLIYGDNKNDLAITPQEYCDFLGTIFPFWLKHRARYKANDPFKSFYELIAEKKMTLGCGDSGSCSHDYIEISPDGSVSLCGRSADWGNINFGNIMDSSLQEIFHHPDRDALRIRNTILQQGDCNGCKYWTICHGGCPLDSYNDTQTFENKSPWCAARKGFIEKYFEPITGIKFEPDAQGII